MRLLLLIVATALSFGVSSWLVKHVFKAPEESLWEFVPPAIGFVVLAAGFVKDHRVSPMPLYRYLQLFVGAGILAAIFGRVLAMALLCLSRVCQ